MGQGPGLGASPVPGIQVAIKVHRVGQLPDNGLAARDDELTLTSAKSVAELGDGLYAVEPDADPTRPGLNRVITSTAADLPIGASPPNQTNAVQRRSSGKSSEPSASGTAPGRAARAMLREFGVPVRGR